MPGLYLCPKSQTTPTSVGKKRFKGPSTTLRQNDRDARGIGRMKVSDEKNLESGSLPETRQKKRISPSEMHFAKLMYSQNMGGIAAARLAFNWPCNKGTKEAEKAKSLARSDRVQAEIEKLRNRDDEKHLAAAKAKESLRVDFGDMHKSDLREYAFKVLGTLRDNENAKAADRFNAIKMLKKLHDPGKDVNLIYKWVDLAWRYQTAHCPCCHTSFGLADIPNEKLNSWRERTDADPAGKKLDRQFDRRCQRATTQALRRGRTLGRDR